MFRKFVGFLLPIFLITCVSVTRLMVAYLQKEIQQQGFSTSYDPTQNSQKNTKILEN